MKRRLILGVGLLALLGAALVLSGCVEIPIHEANRLLTGSFDVTGPVDLDVRTSNGRVTVRGVEGQTSVEVIATLPRSATGKVLKRELRARESGSA